MKSKKMVSPRKRKWNLENDKSLAGGRAAPLDRPHIVKNAPMIIGTFGADVERCLAGGRKHKKIPSLSTEHKRINERYDFTHN